MQILVALMIVIQATTNPNGFLVVESTHNEIKVLRTQEMAIVDSLANVYHVDARALLENNNYFEVSTDWNRLYVEKRRVIKKNGKLKYKRL